MSDPYQDAAEALPEEVRRLLRRADGFLDLRMLERAGLELEQVPPACRDNLVCQRVHLRMAVAARDWPHCASLAASLADACPDDCGLWIEWAYATRRAAGIPEARSILMKAWDRFPRVAVIPFNLACYACREGDPEGARDLLARAFALDEAYRELALEDEDLKELWDDLGG